MIKKRVLREIGFLKKALKLLFLLEIVFAFLFVYSYVNVSFSEGEGINFNKMMEELFSKKFDVSVVVGKGFMPVILLSENETYVCEGSFMDFPVVVMDNSGTVPEGSLSIINPFYIVFFSKVGEFLNEFRIVSPVLSKEDAGGVNKGYKTYEEVIYMANGDFVASKDFNITVVEINNAPRVEDIGVKTVWIKGENSVFDYKWNISDVEDGGSDSLNLSFSISFEGDKLFDIGPRGEMYFKPNESHIGVHNLTVCVKDRGIKKPHEKIVLCNQDGGSIAVCDNFSLTVTNKNRAPIITNYSPSNLTVTVRGEESISFNISAYDPDGNLVDVYWYVDGSLKKYESQKKDSNFSFSYVCRFYGKSRVVAVISDGELNSSVVWNVSVSVAVCPTSSGGGGGGVSCNERWVCDYWLECRNLKQDSALGKIDYKTNVLIGERCNLLGLKEESCGFQKRSCKDLKKCGSNLSMPPLIRECFFVENPSCTDGIKNCHDGGCEIGVDCGGSCLPCPTCSDGIKNQNEEKVDCGGVCDPCEEEAPKKTDFFKILMYISLVFLILALIGITVLGVRYIILKKKLEQVSRSF